MKNPNKLIVGTRGSPLALRQTEQFCQSLQGLNPDYEVEFKKIITSGDRIQDRFLASVGGKGLFVKEIEEALLAESIDFAVHSLKDLPAELPSDLELACFPKRHAPWDVLVTPQGGDWSQLKSGARIGTTSLRRRSQLKVLRGDLQFEMLRGNIDTRLRKLSEGLYDGIVLAQAGMERLGLDLGQASPLPIIPAPGQGALVIQARRSDEGTKKCLEKLHDPETALLTKLERWVMAEMGGDCNLPLGALATREGENISLEVYVGLEDGSEWIQVKKTGKNSKELLAELLKELNEKGAKKIMAATQNKG